MTNEPTTELCRFLVRAEGETPADIRRCDRQPAEHPVTDRGRFGNHRNHLP